MVEIKPESLVTKELDEKLKALESKRGVVGVIVFTQEFGIIKTTLLEDEAKKYVKAFGELIKQSQAATKEIDTTNDLTFLRVRTKKHEVMVWPDSDFLMMVLMQI